MKPHIWNKKMGVFDIEVDRITVNDTSELCYVMYSWSLKYLKSVQRCFFSHTEPHLSSDELTTSEVLAEKRVDESYFGASHFGMWCPDHDTSASPSPVSPSWVHRPTVTRLENNGKYLGSPVMNASMFRQQNHQSNHCHLGKKIQPFLTQVGSISAGDGSSSFSL